MTKKQREALANASCLLEAAAVDASAAHYYFDNDAEIKGFNFGYITVALVEEALETLLKLFPPTE